MPYVEIKVTCPRCKKLLRRTSNPIDSKSRTKGFLTCPVCRKRVEYVIQGGTCVTRFS